MPGAVPVTSTKGLTNVTLPYVEAIADKGVSRAIAEDPALAKGVNVIGGRITYEAVASAHGLHYTPLATHSTQPALRRPQPPAQHEATQGCQDLSRRVFADCRRDPDHGVGHGCGEREDRDDVERQLE